MPSQGDKPAHAGPTDATWSHHSARLRWVTFRVTKRRRRSIAVGTPGERDSRTGLPPWVFNGKTSLRPGMKDPRGRKIRRYQPRDLRPRRESGARPAHCQNQSTARGIRDGGPKLHSQILWGW